VEVQDSRQREIEEIDQRLEFYCQDNFTLAAVLIGSQVGLVSLFGSKEKMIFACQRRPKQRLKMIKGIFEPPKPNHGTNRY